MLVEAMRHIFPGLFNRHFGEKQHLFELEILCNNVEVFTVTYDQFNVIAVSNIYLFKYCINVKVITLFFIININNE